MVLRRNLFYPLIGAILYSFYLLGVLTSNIQGLSLLFLLVLFILLDFRAKDFKINRSVLLFPLYLNIIVILSYFYSYHSSYSQYKLIFFLLKFNTLFFIPFFIRPEKVRPFFDGIIFILFTVLIILSFYTVANIGSFDANNRLEVGILNPIWISRMALELVLILYFLYTPSLFLKALYVVPILLILYASGSKGPVLAFLVVLALYKFRNVNFYIKLVSLSTLVLLAYFLFNTLSVGIENDYIRERFFTIIPEGDEEKLMQDNRAIFIPFLLQKYFSSDLFTVLFGSGLGNSGYFMYGANYDFRYYPHNLIVELLLELGIVNLVILLYFIFKYIKSSNSIFVYILMFFIFNSMFSGDLILNEFIFLYLGFTIANSNTKFISKFSITQSEYKSYPIQNN